MLYQVKKYIDDVNPDIYWKVFDGKISIYIKKPNGHYSYVKKFNDDRLYNCREYFKQLSRKIKLEKILR